MKSVFQQFIKNSFCFLIACIAGSGICLHSQTYKTDLYVSHNETLVADQNLNGSSTIEESKETELLCQQTSNTKAKTTTKSPGTSSKPKVSGTSTNNNPPSTTTTPVKTTQNTNSYSVSPQEKMDTIIKLGGKRIICSVKKINASSVTYSLPNSSNMIDLPRKDIEKIIYKNGKIDVFNKPVFAVVDQMDWQAVMITENPADVRGLYQRGVIKATASSGSRSPKAAKQNATIRLQKKAANMGAMMVLIVRSEMKGGYGEIPGWELEGIAYSDTPPSDTAAVNKAIRELIERTRLSENNKKQ
jgi:hypothetical protein